MKIQHSASFYDGLAAGTIVRSPSEALKVAEILSPLWPHYQAWKRQKEKQKRRAYAVYAVVFLLAALLFRNCAGLQWWLFAHLRIAVTTLPWLSHVRLSTNDCLVPNILLSYSNTPPAAMNEEIAVDCWSCESLTEPRIVNVADAGAIARLAAWTQPMLVPVHNGTPPASHTIYDVMLAVSSHYNSRPGSEPCRVMTNFPRGFDDFLVRYNRYKEQAWFAQWQNCDHDVTKALRFLCKRPSFLPRSFSTMGASWIFLASNYEAQVFRLVEVSEPWFLLTQVAGKGALRLTPKTPCRSICHDAISIPMNTSLVALVPTSVWSVSYMPVMDESGESIAYGVESYQDAKL